MEISLALYTQTRSRWFRKNAAKETVVASWSRLFIPALHFKTQAAGKCH